MPEIPKLSTRECHNFKRKLKYIRHDYNSMHKHVSTNMNSVKQNRHQTCSTNILQVDKDVTLDFIFLRAQQLFTVEIILLPSLKINTSLNIRLMQPLLLRVICKTTIDCIMVEWLQDTQLQVWMSSVTHLSPLTDHCDKVVGVISACTLYTVLWTIALPLPRLMHWMDCAGAVSGNWVHKT